MSGELVNPNTPVTESLTSNNVDGSKTVDVSGGPATFAELEAAMTKTKAEKRAEKKEAKPEPKDSEVKAPPKEGKGENDKDDKPAPKESKESKNESKDSKDEKAPPRKTIKAKYNDTETELDEEALIPVTVNGKEELWTLKELRADKSGKTAWDKRFTELSGKEKTHAQQQQKLTDVVNSIKDAFTEKDENLRIMKMAKISGIDPVQFRKDFLTHAQNVFEKRAVMSDAELAADDASFEASIYKNRADTLEKAQADQQSEVELLGHIDQLRASHEIEEQDFYNRFGELSQKVQQGKLDPKKLTPDYVAFTINVDRYWNQAADSLDKLELGWDQEKRGNTIHSLVENAMKLGFKPSDLPGIVDEVYGVKKAQSKINEKIRDNEKFRTGKDDSKVTPTPNKPIKEEPMFFSDL